MSIDMYGEKVAEASGLIREFAKVDYFHYFARDPESSLEEFIAMQDSAHAAGRESALSELHPQWLEEKERADKASERITELERQVASAERCFMMACEDLGLINEKLGLDPDDGGAEPILEAIDALAASQHKAGVQWQSMQSAPKDGREILTRYPKQGNVKQLIYFDAIHKTWCSKGVVAFPEQQKCEWHPLPADSTSTTEGEQSNG